jgi:hypothetical protein
MVMLIDLAYKTMFGTGLSTTIRVHVAVKVSNGTGLPSRWSAAVQASHAVNAGYLSAGYLKRRVPLASTRWRR